MGTPKKLLLWDIDGTLVCTGQAGEFALIRAMKVCHNLDVTLNNIDYRGRTDALIARNLFAAYQISVTPHNLHNFLEAYLAALAEELPQRSGKTYPGVLTVLEEARQRPDLVQGLLTGNMVRGAELKLSHFNVWHYFEFGAFANDSHIRNELGPYALRRAKEKHGIDFPPERVFIIGDTPHDIACGKTIGAHTIAVATGSFSQEELRKHEPSVVFADFSQPEAFFAAINRLGN